MLKAECVVLRVLALYGVEVPLCTIRSEAWARGVPATEADLAVARLARRRVVEHRLHGWVLAEEQGR